MNLSKSLPIYTVSSIINSSIPFLLVPFLTEHLSPESYGVLSMVAILLMLVTPFVSLNIANVLTMEFKQIKANDFPSFLTSILIIPLFSSIVMILVMILLMPLISSFVLGYKFIIVLIPVISLFQIYPSIILVLYQMRHKPLSFGAFQFFLSLTNLILTIVFVFFLELDWLGRIYAILTTNILFTLISFTFYYIHNLIIPKIKLKYIYSSIRLGAPLILHSLSAVLIMSSDRIFLQKYYGNYLVGIYSVAVQISSIILVVQTAINQAWVPFLFDKLKNAIDNNDEKERIKIVKASYLFLIFYIGLPFIVYCIGYFALKFIINSDYKDAIDFVFFLSVSYSFLGIYKISTNILFYFKKTKLLSILTFCSLILNLILNLIGINLFGAIGVVYASVLTFFLFSIIVFYMSNRIYPLPWTSVIKFK